jgi:hypothetical protein
VRALKLDLLALARLSLHACWLLPTALIARWTLDEKLMCYVHKRTAEEWFRFDRTLRG